MRIADEGKKHFGFTAVEIKLGKRFVYSACNVFAHSHQPRYGRHALEMHAWIARVPLQLKGVDKVACLFGFSGSVLISH